MKLMEMSISAGVLILLIVLLRMIGFFRLSKRLFVVLWMITIARLLLPVSLPIKNGIATPVIHLLKKALYILNKDLFYAESVPVSNTVRGIVSAAPAAGREGCIWDILTRDVSPALYAVWIAGAVGFGIYFLYSFQKESQMMAQAIPLGSMQKESDTCIQSDGREWEGLLKSYENAQMLTGIRGYEKNSCHGKIYIHDRIQSPFVWGMVRQRIVFPKSLCHMEQVKIQYMLTHEFIHMKRHDNLWKLLSAAVVCLHWFNPLVWVMYILLAMAILFHVIMRMVLNSWKTALLGSMAKSM